MKIKEILDKLNKFYADLIRDGRDGDVIRAIQDPDYLNEIWAQLETMDDSVWIENFWNKLVELSKSGDDQKIEQLQKNKENIIPKKLFRFRPILGNIIRYKNNPISNYLEIEPFVRSSSITDKDLIELAYDNYIDIISLFKVTKELDNRVSELNGNLYCANAFYQNDPYDSTSIDYSDWIGSLEPESRKALSNALYEHVHYKAFSSSFSAIEKPDSLPMWYHYAEDYNGCCLEYDTSRQDWSNWKRALYPVHYSKKLIGLKEYVEESRQSCCLPRNIIPFLTLKLMDWSYENEWRVILEPSLIKNLKADEYKLIKHDKCPTPDIDIMSRIFVPSLENNMLYNQRHPRFNPDGMLIKGILLKKFPKPSAIYFPDIKSNRLRVYSEKSDILFIAAQRKLRDTVMEINRNLDKNEQIACYKMRFGINGVTFCDYDEK